MTRTASDNALKLGLMRSDVVQVVQSMERRHFYKSMTSFQDPRTWQDVYHVPWGTLMLYIKLSVDSQGRLLLQLKEK